MVVVNENVKLHENMLASDHYQSFFYDTLNQTNNRHRLSGHGKVSQLYKAAIPAPLAPIIASLLTPCFDPTLTDVYSPSIGNGSLLAGFKHPLIFNVNEPDPSNFKLLKRFTEWGDRHHKDQDSKISYFITNKEIGSIAPTKKYDLSIALLPAGVSPISTLIPFLDAHGGRHLSLYTDMLDQTLMIETLNERNPEGRSVFLGPIEDNSHIGKIGRHYVHLLQWLQAYFHDVSVIDLNTSLFNQTAMPAPSRLYVVGAAKDKPRNPTVLNERISHLTETFNIPVFNTYSQLVEFEQAVRLIDTSKRRPEIDLSANDTVDGDNLHVVDEEQSLISLFYTLRPKTTKESLVNPKPNRPLAAKSSQPAPISLYVSDSGEPITEAQASSDENIPDTTSYSPSKGVEGQSDTEAPVLDFDDLYDTAVNNGVGTDDMIDMHNMEGPQDTEYDISMLSGGYGGEPDIEAFESHDQSAQEPEGQPSDNDDTMYQSMGDVIITRRNPVASDTQYQTIGDEGDGEWHEHGDEHEHNRYANEPNHPDGLEQKSPYDDEDDEDDEDDGEYEDDNDEEEGYDEEEDTAWFDGNDLEPVYYGPRYIDNPQKYLIQRDNSNSNQINISPPIFNPDNTDPATDKLIAHKISEFKNMTVRAHFERVTPPIAQGQLKSLSMVETHMPALLILNPQDIDTPETLPLDNFPDGEALQSYLDGKKEEGYDIHSIFSLRSHQHNVEIAPILEQIEQINTWLQLSSSNALALNTLYEADAKTFFELYQLASRYHETVQPSISRAIKHEIKMLKPHGEARLYEYKARYWVRNPDLIADKDTDKPFCLAFEPSDIDDVDLNAIATQIITLSNQSVYSPAFSQDFNLLAKYMVPTDNLSLVSDITTKLASPKELSFLVFMRLTVQINALFLAGAHRFFLYTCNIDSYKAWLGRLYSHKDAPTDVLDTPAYRASQALDVDYARHLLQNPVLPFDSEAIRRFQMRYNSHSSYQQATRKLQVQAQQDVQSALMCMQELWEPITPGFSINAWFSEHTLVEADTVNVEVVDMVFMAVTNTLLKRPTYFYNEAAPKHLQQFLGFVAKVLERLNLSTVCTTTAKLSSVAIQASNEAGVAFVQKNVIANKKGIDCVVAIHTNPDIAMLMDGAYGTATTIHYIDHAPASYDGSVKRLCQLGQLLPFNKPQLNITLRQLPHTANQHVMTEVYEQYSRAFDGMRQLGVLAYKMAGTLKRELLGDLLLSCSSSSAFSWWLENQGEFLYGTPTDALIAKRKSWLADLKAKPSLTDGDKAALHAIAQEVELFLPNIKTCNADAWLASIYSHLVASLQSPQVVTECLEFIKNGLQPLLLIDRDYDDLLHHVLVSEQGRSLPFSEIFELKREKQALRQALSATPTNAALLTRLAHVNKSLSDFEKQRQDEVLALVHQKKTFTRPLIVDALRCFLLEVGQFYIQDTTGKQQALMTSDTRQAIEKTADYNSFRQLLNTLMQMIDDDVFARLPLPTLDVIAEQLKRHGHSLKHPNTRPYALQNDDKDSSLWFLGVQEANELEQVDMRVITCDDAGDVDAIRHPARQSRLVLASLPSSQYALNQTKAVIEKLSPLLSSLSDITVWAGAPLSTIDDVRHKMLEGYLGELHASPNLFLSAGAVPTAYQYLHTVMHLVPTSHVHIASDMPYLLSLIAQKPKAAQIQHLTALENQLIMQNKLNDSIAIYGKPRLPQVVFTRRTPAQSNQQLSVEALLHNQAATDAKASSTASLFLGVDDTIYDVYYKDHYKPLDIESILNQAAKLTITFQKDLNGLIDNHPDKDRIYTSLSDHESNPEADYFIELDDNKKKAYVYKHLIRDMAYRGIKHRVLSDLHDNQSHMPVLFNNNRALIATELMNTKDSYQNVRVLCEYIQELTGVSKYAEQLQAQLTAKNIIDYQVEAVCQLSSDEVTSLRLPVITCRPKTHLKTSLLTKNMPAISRMFGRYFSEVPPNDNVFLGKNEWLITCGFKLPHYERVFDLNNLLCYVATVGNDINKAPATFLTNARHLYTDYVEKKALLVEGTHDVYQGELTLLFEPQNTGFKLQKNNAKYDVMSTSVPISWHQLETDIELFGETKGIGYEQVVMGENEYYEYCQNNPEFFELVSFNDVSGKNHTAIKMTDQAKTRLLDFRTFFKLLIPLKPPIAIDYLTRSMRDKANVTVSCYSSVLNSTLRLEVAYKDDKPVLFIEPKRPSAAAQLADVLGTIKARTLTPKLFKYAIPDADVTLLVKVLGISGFYINHDADTTLLSATEDYATRLLARSENITSLPSLSLRKKSPMAMIGGVVKSLAHSV